MLFVCFVDAADRVDGALDGPQDGREKCPLAGEDARHVAAERFRQRDDQHRKERDLNPSIHGHLEIS